MESQIWGSVDLRRDVSEIAIGADDLHDIAYSVKFESWKLFKQHMDKANVKLIHYVLWNEDDKRADPDEWNRLQKAVAKLGVKLINLAR